MPHYELMCVASPAATAGQLTNLFKILSSVINRGGGVFRRLENLGTRPLAYRMHKNQKYCNSGRYIRVNIQANPNLLRDVQKRLLIDDQILRFLTMRQELAPSTHNKSDRKNKLLQQNQESNSTSQAVNIDNIQLPANAKQPAPLTQGSIAALQSSSALDYYAARTLLTAGRISREEIMRLPRHNFDAAWESQREKLLQPEKDKEAKAAAELKQHLLAAEKLLNEKAAAERAIALELEEKQKITREIAAVNRDNFKLGEENNAGKRAELARNKVLLIQVKREVKELLRQKRAKGIHLEEEEKEKIVQEKLQVRMQKDKAYQLRIERERAAILEEYTKNFTPNGNQQQQASAQ
jgi:small subunit ribosomal protein S6